MCPPQISFPGKILPSKQHGKVVLFFSFTVFPPSLQWAFFLFHPPSFPPHGRPISFQSSAEKHQSSSIFSFINTFIHFSKLGNSACLIWNTFYLLLVGFYSSGMNKTSEHQNNTDSWIFHQFQFKRVNFLPFQSRQKKHSCAASEGCRLAVTHIYLPSHQRKLCDLVEVEVSPIFFCALYTMKTFSWNDSTELKYSGLSRIKTGTVPPRTSPKTTNYCF